MENGKLISIVVAVYNGSRTLEKLFDSIRYQKSQDIQLVVIDGGSTDGTQSIVRSASDIVDYFISEPDSGIYNAWNKGLSVARGKWIAFIGADDFYAEGALNLYRDVAFSAPGDIEYISSKVRYHAPYGRPEIIGRPWSWPAFQRYMTVAHVGSLHKRTLFDRLGSYDETYRICGDYELLLRARNTLKTLFVDQLTVEMGGEGVSNNRLEQTYAENARARHITGGRGKWRVVVEKKWDFFRARVKRQLGRVM